MSAIEKDRGVDLFDFIYEIWRAKWLFLGVVFLTIGVGFAISLLLNQRTETERVGVAIDFRLHGPDPLNRDRNALLDDLVRGVDKKFRFFLSSQLESIGETERDSTILLSKRRTYIDSTRNITITAAFGHENAGRLFIFAEKEEASLVHEIGNQLERSSQEQVVDTKRIVEREMASIRSAAKEMQQYIPLDASVIDDGDWRSWVVKRIIQADMFLWDPAVMSGDFRLVKLLDRPPGAAEEYSRTSNSDSASIRELVVLALLGGTIGVVAIMFRVAIRRSRRPSAV